MLLGRARRVVAAHEAELLERVPEKLRPVVLPVLMALWQGEPQAAAAQGSGR
jgi:hypothetical protein